MQAIPLNPISEQAKFIIDEVNASAVRSKSIDELADEAFIPQGIEIPKPTSVFDMDGIPVFTKKSLSTLIGKAKSGKTTCTAWVTAQIIKAGSNILWIDTEQGTYYGSRTQHWVLTIAGVIESECLRFYDLKIHNPTIRTEIIESLIIKFEPDIVIIDGVRDLVFDINEPKEATNMTGCLMRWADQYDCHILSILHQNKGNEHARGHLGSEMVNKSETVIKVSKDDKGLTLCEPEFTRGEPFPIFAFDRDTYGLPQIVNYVPKITSGETNAKKVLPIDITKETHLDCLKIAFGEDLKKSYGDLTISVSAAFEYFGMPMGVVKSKSYMQFYIQQGYLLMAGKEGKFTYYEINKTK